MALVNIKFHKNCIEWDLGITTNTLQDIGSKGVITSNVIREMYLLHNDLGVAIDIEGRNFKPLQANIHLSIWDNTSGLNVEHTPTTNLELFNLMKELYIKQF